MSLPDQEARALNLVHDFMLRICSGDMKFEGHVNDIRKEARSIMKHYPLAAGIMWLSMTEDVDELKRRLEAVEQAAGYSEDGSKSYDYQEVQKALYGELN